MQILILTKTMTHNLTKIPEIQQDNKNIKKRTPQWSKVFRP